MEPITTYIEELSAKGPRITPEALLHSLHESGYPVDESVLQVKHHFNTLTADEMCRLVVNEYVEPLISKAETRRVLLLCEYGTEDVDTAMRNFYPETLGYVLMLDDSASMKSASSIIKIDAKAFMDCSRTGDRFGVNKFEVNSHWVYPTGTAPSPAIVSEDRSEMAKAAAEIDKLTTSGSYTNIGEAIQLGNKMISQMDTQKKAFILISDGEKNRGVEPDTVLLEEPPIYIAALGPYMREAYFKKMLAKNPKSRFYSSPNAIDMMKIFNEIMADSTESTLALNHLAAFTGANYLINEFYISGTGNSSLLNVVWSDSRYQYTSGYPGEYAINLVLVDPSGSNTSLRPVISEPGYCIFDLRNLRPGKWKALSQYSVKDTVNTTIGVLQTGTGHNVTVSGTHCVNAGELAPFTVMLAGDDIDPDTIQVSVVYSSPVVSVTPLMDEYAENPVFSSASPIRSRNMTDKSLDISARFNTIGSLDSLDRNVFSGIISETQNTGFYNAYLTVTGVDKKTGIPFCYNKTHSVCVVS